jgi:membrane-associated protease RseP (regulator of RpoE activity)
MGAIIRMDGRIPDRRALFDIGISGPLAGLVPTLVCIFVGLEFSKLTSTTGHSGLEFGEPLLFQWLIALKFAPLPPDVTVMLHPLAMAGWVGLFLTSLNLMPIGQLDGGHVFYAILRKKAWDYASLLLLLFVGLVFIFQYWQWSLMLVLLMLMGPRHPPTQHDAVPIGRFRQWLGWATLAFVIIGFTPEPIILNEKEEPARPADQFPMASETRSLPEATPRWDGNREI